ncbi:MAG: type II toxin-antitoxin system RelE/ParE family toxin, partial [Gammaproteobacteria bacterium]
MSFRFHPDAEAELSEAIQYYENVESGLGQDFAVEA